MRNFLLLVIFFSLWSYGESSSLFDEKSLSASHLARPLKTLPVQDRGRLKPFDTFARESVSHIFGKSNSSSLHWVMTWMLAPEEWDSKPLIFIQKSFVKKSLELDEKSSHFSPKKLLDNKNFQRELRELHAQREKKLPLDNYFSEIQKIESQLSLYQAIRGGMLPVWVFQNKAASLGSLEEGEERQSLLNIFKSYSSAITLKDTSVLEEFVKQKEDLFSEQNSAQIKVEVFYNMLNPFRWAWLFYLLSLALFCSLIIWPVYQKYFFYSSLIFAFLIHTFGIVLRVYIMERPPVSNMFETLLWVPWAAVVLSSVFSFLKKTHLPIAAGAVVSFLCLFISDTAGVMLGNRLDPLEAVLRSNFWLSTHVLVITLSYSAFFLAFVLGDFLIFRFLLRRPKVPQKFSSQDEMWFLVRSIQAGVLLLALGTILGALWADYSWGRFWGWDPKEVWALVSLLGYLALLHARVKGWLKDFGMTMGAVACFFLIVMAWYGVNFVLGKGLHSYGFGQGGLSYVLSFTVLHFALLWLAWRKKNYSKKNR